MAIPVAIQRIMDEVRGDPARGSPNAYDRAHNRHNRSGYNRGPDPDPAPPPPPPPDEKEDA